MKNNNYKKLYCIYKTFSKNTQAMKWHRSAKKQATRKARYSKEAACFEN